MQIYTMVLIVYTTSWWSIIEECLLYYNRHTNLFNTPCHARTRTRTRYFEYSPTWEKYPKFRTAHLAGKNCKLNGSSTVQQVKGQCLREALSFPRQNCTSITTRWYIFNGGPCVGSHTKRCKTTKTPYDIPNGSSFRDLSSSVTCVTLLESIPK